MSYILDNLQLNLANLSSAVYTTWYFIGFYISHSVVYLSGALTSETRGLEATANLVLHWVVYSPKNNLWSGLIHDKSAYIWLFNEGNGVEFIAWHYASLQFKMLKDLVDFFCYAVPTKVVPLACFIVTYKFILLFAFVKYSALSLILLNLLFYTKSNVRGINSISTIMYSKFSYLVESEEELGAVDDLLFFFGFFVILFGWFFLSMLIFANTHIISISYVSIGFIALVIFVMLIPTGLLVDFGISYASYIRGASTSASILVEVVFDFIGTLVVFTRFIVQNIRFVLIMAAYFELFEYMYTSPYAYFLNCYTINDISELFVLAYNKPSNGYFYVMMIFTGTVNYLYYFLHLIILIFIQLGAYFLISFWLFFFFYTSFYLTKDEKFFFYKRYLLN